MPTRSVTASTAADRRMLWIAVGLTAIGLLLGSLLGAAVVAELLAPPTVVPAPLPSISILRV